MQDSNKSEGEGAGLAEHADKDGDDYDLEFAEIDPTGRYGRYKEVLGKGAFKTVYRAFDEVDGIEVAWNQVKIQDVLQSSEELERLYSEVHLLKTLKHKNIIKFYNSWVDAKDKNVNFITEIFTSGTLRQYRMKHKHVDIRAVKNWARQILRGLLYLHSHDPPIIHRDLKCDNIFVNGNHGEVKIGDLGLATILRQAHAAHSVIGTPEFMAPELYEEEYNELVDIYSFGMCLLEMVTFEYPYSECANAAQIYKKVTSGKKPAALDKVKDLEVRQFIEKCLATASKRLPARELLMDPFLQSEGLQETVDYAPLMRHQEVHGDDMEDLVTCLSGSGRGQWSGSSIDSSAIHARSGDGKGCSIYPRKTLSNAEMLNTSLLSPSPKHDQTRRSRDFRVKGKKRDDSTVFLRLRIADAEGHIRNIHFLFDIEGDSALSVASEMVEELDLSDQDVTTIAEIIDAEILALVPDWKPGASFDETGPDGEDSENQIQLSPEHCDDQAGSEVDLEHIDILPQEELSLERTIAIGKIQSPPFRPRLSDATSPTKGESMMYGRFEEVTYNQDGSDYSPSSSEALMFSSDSSEVHVGQDGRDHVTGQSSSVSPVSDCARIGEWSIACENCADNIEAEKGIVGFNELVESQRNAGHGKYTHESWEGIMAMGTEPEGQASSVKLSGRNGSEVYGIQAENDCQGQLHMQQSLTPLVLHNRPDLPDEEEEALDQELKLLILKQEEELQELQRKHKEAVLEVRNRWRQRSNSHLVSPEKMQSDSAMQCGVNV